MKEKTCGDCKAFLIIPSDEEEDDESLEGYCRLNPPTALYESVDDGFIHDFTYPQVNENTYACMQWKAKKED